MGVAVVGVGCGDALALWNWTRRFIVDALNGFQHIVACDAACNAYIRFGIPKLIWCCSSNGWACSLMFAAA